MKPRRIAAFALTALTLAGTSGVAAAATPTTVRTLKAAVGSRTETILVNSQGKPLYYYGRDTAKKSYVSGGLAAFWPPLDSAHPTLSGAPGRLSVLRDANGNQVLYNGHFLYTFSPDKSGHVTGQGVQNFFVATPGLARLASAVTAKPAPAAPSSGYGSTSGSTSGSGYSSGPGYSSGSGSSGSGYGY